MERKLPRRAEISAVDRDERGRLNHVGSAKLTEEMYLFAYHLGYGEPSKGIRTALRVCQSIFQQESGPHGKQSLEDLASELACLAAAYCSDGVLTREEIFDLFQKNGKFAGELAEAGVA